MILLEIICLTLFWAWCFSAILFLRNTLLPKVPITVTPAQWDLPFETVQFQASDGLHLEGWAIVADPTHPWMILCHGVGSNRADLMDIAAGLHAGGFNLLLFDFRGHGSSAGRVTSFGWLEQRDLEGALAYLGRQAEVPAAPYGIYGISMGGTVALMVAARDERVGAVAVDSPYPNLDESLAHHIALLYPALPRVPFLWFIRWTYRLRFGVWPAAMDPERAAARLSPRPLFLIQGGDDARVPVSEGRRIFEAARQPKDLWVIERAGHLEGYALNPTAYCQRLTEFFQQVLK